jgi:nucleoside-triphosphate--adenylate kinase
VKDDPSISKITDSFAQHWILDGFPRTVGQGKLLDAHLRLAAFILYGRLPFLSYVGLRKQGLPLSLVVNLDVPDEVILARISDRWVHLPSGRVYNLSYNRPRVDGLDDETGEPLTKRPDDNPVRVERRGRIKLRLC